jgi:hypothetical protein
MKVFISYNRNVEPDEPLALYLYRFLKEHGHIVFIDQAMRTGVEWSQEIQTQIEASDFLLVLLSKASVDSEMVVEGVEYAHRREEDHGHPRILPVRVTYIDPLPYRLGAYLDPLQYALWQSESDNEPLAQAILEAINSAVPLPQEPIEFPSVGAGATVSEDGRVISDEETMPPPLPEIDPRFIEALEVPGGAVRLRSKFYIERSADAQVRRQVLRSGTTTTIGAPRQTGKSSLLVRAVHHARENGHKVVYLDFQRIDPEYLQTLDLFLRYFAEMMVRKLHLEPAEVEQSWRGSLGPQDKLTYLLEDYILSEIEAPIVLAMDEVDRLLQTPFHTEFFGMLRAWHNSRAINDLWNILNVVMVISTEPYLLIDDIYQSPFNVGLRLYLDDFDEAQVRDLNHLHGAPLADSDLPRLMTILNGHPYLTRKALYTLVVEGVTWAELTKIATTDASPFGDHLRRYLWLLYDKPELTDAMKSIIRDGTCPDEALFYRLYRAGLVKGSSKACTCRCLLYEAYLQRRL